MGDGSRTDRIVTAPAKKATGYGKQAAATTAEVALGEVAEAVWNAIIDHVGLRAAARDAAAPLWVGAARNLWVGLARTEPSLKPVVIADLAWYAGFASALAAKPAIAELDGLYGAWTNSSTLVLVSDQIFGLGSEVARILLRHEAQHAISFRANGDRPPVSYSAMATFERDAYTKTKAELDPLTSSTGAYDDLYEYIEDLVMFFTDMAAKPTGAATNEEIRQAMLGHVFQGKPDPLLPPSAGKEPSNLYIP